MIRPETRVTQTPDSFNIARLAYETSERVLVVRFTSDQIYQYSGVPLEVYEDLRHADSVGSAFDRLIRKGGYEYENLGRLNAESGAIEKPDNGL